MDNNEYREAMRQIIIQWEDGDLNDRQFISYSIANYTRHYDWYLETNSAIKKMPERKESDQVR